MQLKLKKKRESRNNVLCFVGHIFGYFAFVLKHNMSTINYNL